MSLVSNFIGGISSTQFGNEAKVSNTFDLDDTTFADLLQKHLEKRLEQPTEGMSIEGLGMPAGITIENMDIPDIPQIEETDTNNNIEKFNNKLKNDITSSETATFFNSLLGNSISDNSHSELFDFAKKQAANLYNKYSKNVITDVNEFVDDVKEMIN